MLGQADAVAAQKRRDGLDLDGAPDNAVLARLGLEDRHRILGFDLLAKPLKRLGGELDLSAIAQTGGVRHIAYLPVSNLT